MTVLPTATPITLTLATPSDLPAVLEILAQSYLTEPIARFYLTSWPSLDAMRPFFTARLKRRFAQAATTPEQTQIFKLTNPADGEIIGTVCVSEEFDEEVKERDPRNMEGHDEPLEGVNMPFAMEFVRISAPLEGLMVGKRHLLVTSFGVLPKYQGKGYGSLLLQKCSEIADERNLPLFLTALPNAYGLYVKNGYEEIEHVEFDLAKWGKPYSGNGIYRNFAMLREPSGGRS